MTRTFTLTKVVRDTLISVNRTEGCDRKRLVLSGSGKGGRAGVCEGFVNALRRTAMAVALSKIDGNDGVAYGFPTFVENRKLIPINALLLADP